MYLTAEVKQKICLNLLHGNEKLNSTPIPFELLHYWQFSIIFGLCGCPAVTGKKDTYNLLLKEDSFLVLMKTVLNTKKKKISAKFKITSSRDSSYSDTWPLSNTCERSRIKECNGLQWKHGKPSREISLNVHKNIKWVFHISIKQF